MKAKIENVSGRDRRPRGRALGLAPGAGGRRGRKGGVVRRKFEFEVNAPAVTRERVAGDIRRLGAKLKRPVRTVDWIAWAHRPCSVPFVIALFGSWGGALRAAGLDRSAGYGAEHLMKKLEAAWRELGRPPGGHALRRIAKISNMPYVKRWGTLRGACERLAAYKRGEITRARLLEPVAHPGRSVPMKLRYQILERDGYRCRLCGAGAEEGAKLHIDHIVPVSKGGGSEPDNLRVLCAECNVGKGARCGRKKAPLELPGGWARRGGGVGKARRASGAGLARGRSR
jgi:HNH endonuclease/Homing endonuclease associated repeat